MTDLTDAQRMYILLRDSGLRGVHSRDLRVGAVSGNPSQRAKDIVGNGAAVSTRREANGKRPGSRYWLAECAPPDAVPVVPDGGSPATVGATQSDVVATVWDFTGEPVDGAETMPCGTQVYARRLSNYERRKA